MDAKLTEIQFLHDRLDAISEGLKEAIRREVRRLRDQGLPVYVADNGKVVASPPPPTESPSTKPNES